MFSIPWSVDLSPYGHWDSNAAMNVCECVGTFSVLVDTQLRTVGIVELVEFLLTPTY